MSLYDLATSANYVQEQIFIIKPLPQAADDDAGDNPAQPVAANTQGNQQTATALTKIARFIPTETITIYLGAVSAAAAMTGEGANPGKLLATMLNQETVYWITAFVITPAIFMLIWAIERTKSKKPFWSEFPYWKLSAAIIAFLIWALAVPGSPYAESPVAKVAIAFAAILVSIILDLIDQLYEARRSNSAAVV